MSSEGVKLTTTIDDKASPAVARLAAKVKNLGPALDEIGASNVTETQHRFETESGPDGAKWVGLAATTLARRGPGAKILRDKVHLYDSVTHKVEGVHSVSIGSNKVYARVHQLGGQAGRGRKVTIPARPYLGVSDAGKKEIVQILTDHIGAQS
jgi:phage virion morphogenesis protein